MDQSPSRVFDSAIPWFESQAPQPKFLINSYEWRSLHVLQVPILCCVHVASNLQAISGFANWCRRLHATWMQHETALLDHFVAGDRVNNRKMWCRICLCLILMNAPANASPSESPGMLLRSPVTLRFSRSASLDGMPGLGPAGHDLIAQGDATRYGIIAIRVLRFAR
jgi:hypothetical protein